MRIKKLALLVAALFLATAWGCGSNMESDGSSAVNPGGIEAAQLVGSDSCKICHNMAHYRDNHLVGSVPNTLDVIHGTHEEYGCETCHGGGQYHYGLGPIPNPRPTVATCATCHDQVDQVVDAANHVFVNNFGNHEPNCAACHEPLLMTLRQVEGNISCSECHNDQLTRAQLAEKPFGSEIYERFAGSRHANQRAREGLCSACHSHEGFMDYVALGEKFTTRGELVANYTAETAPAFMLPVASSTVEGVNTKNCATCHDPHVNTLHGIGDTLASPANVQGFPVEAGTPVPTGGQGQVRVAYSAEFNLCTACHQVELDAVWDEAAGYTKRGMIRYELSEAYAIEGLLSAATGTYDWTRVGYHADSVTGRKFVDTHFAGTIASHIVNMDAGTENVTVVGYNVNPGDKNACTVCHDPHAGNKMLSVQTGQADNNNNLVIDYATGFGQTHGNYIADTFSRQQNGCTPCHTGRDFVKMTNGATLADLGSPRWNTLGCISCHDLAKVPVSTTSTDNAPALAQVRTFPEENVFKFNSGAVVDVATLGKSQICFECHKGRTAGINVADAADPAAGTTNYSISYLHYSPIFATHFGNDSKMVATYEGIIEGVIYRGKSTTHSADPANDAGDGLTYGVEGGASCVDCHNVHTNSIRQSNPNIRNGTTCVTCHGADWTGRATKGNVSTLAGLLIDEVYKDMIAIAHWNTGTPEEQAAYDAFAAGLKTHLTALRDAADEAAGKDLLKTYIKARQSTFPNKTIAHAVTTWKVFYYEDKAAWAHNRNFTYQMLHDAIESIGGEEAKALATAIVARPAS
jgi:cytochrome c553